MDPEALSTPKRAALLPYSTYKLTIGAVVVTLMLWLLLKSSTPSDNLSSLKLVHVHGKLTPREGLSSKWIVVTTINYPTEAIKVFARQPGWKVVVVGDTKTPSDWRYPNCTYLSVQTQAELGYRITSILPFRHYGRKNIGYLYAIQHGAKVIYESDDDNVPSSGQLVYLDEEEEIVSYVHQQDQIAVNVYSHFGQPTVWPRGFPLRMIVGALPPAEEQKKTKPQRRLIPVQQGLADYDPDVDAIFRLTRQLNLFFDGDQPPISLPKGLMCPYNTQNTLYYSSAFWGLLVPITTSFRVCDIWRSYWAQRMLWDIGAELAFLPPSVEQHRNAHDYLADFEDELDLYLLSEDLVRFLIQWKSPSPKLEERILELSKAMVENKFWKYDDAKLTKAWLEDLIAVGYEFPTPIDVSS